MKITNLTKALSQSVKKYKVLRKDINLFQESLLTCLENIAIAEDNKEHEENFKNYIAEFLKKSLFQEHLVNTKERIDLAIYSGKDAKTHINVLIEVKRPSNTNEFLSEKSINKKALHELLLYYLQERVDKKNNNIKHLIATNGYEWFLFKGEDFYTYFYKNTALRKEYQAFRDGEKDSSKNELFYKEIATKYIQEVGEDLNYVYFDFKDYQNLLSLDSKKENPNENKLIPLYKILSAKHLLNKRFGNDSNQLNKQFYEELLHIIGLEEVKNKGKKVIQRLGEGKRKYGSLLESVIFTLEENDYLRKVPKIRNYGKNKKEQVFTIALELCLTWINRILFIKLLESQLLNYHNGDKNYRFVHQDFIHGFDDLEALFFSALAKKQQDRSPRYKEKYQYIPYLNSSLFEPSDLEEKVMQISNVRNENLTFHSRTILKDTNNKTLKGEKNTLAYLFDFLNAYDFGSDNRNQVEEAEHSKTLMSASVLGLIFEKINGYKDGSFYTPSYITMYMSRETLRRAVIQKINTQYEWKCKNFEDLKEDLKDYIREQENRNKSRLEVNQVINTLRICDPAVGSGHFLVSCLNELIAIKSELKILCDEKGERLEAYITLENDELIIENENGEEFNYLPNVTRTHNVQKALFHEKQTLIENCLFAVDINPNSVKICRLRLWIELLKNAYYNQSQELQTLPNIDINIKCGNSLISRFDLQDELKTAFRSKKNKYSLQDYKDAVQEYKQTNDKNRKRQIQTIIDTVKTAFKTDLDKKFKNRIAKARGEYTLLQQEIANEKLFGIKVPRSKTTALKNKKIKLQNAENAKKDILTNAMYQNAFEWRFEFPEVLDDKGNFTGFDVVIGNPPYINFRNIKATNIKKYLWKSYEVSENQSDLFILFIELSYNLLNEKGDFGFIIPNSITNNLKNDKIRKFILDKSSIKDIIDTPIGVFPDATVDTIVLVTNLPKIENSILSSYKTKNEKFEFITKIEQSSFNQNNNYYFDFLTGRRTKALLQKIENNTISLIEICNATGGIKEYQIGKGKPPQTVNERKNKVFNSLTKLDNTWRKHITGSNIHNYFITWNKGYLKYGKWIAEPRRPVFFEGERLIFREIPSKTRLIVAYTDAEYTVKNTAHIFIPRTPYQAKSLLAILNSKLIGFYFINKFSERDDIFPKAKIGQCKLLPINKDILDNETPFIQKVDEILNLKSINPEANTSKLESEIDRLVYKLYDLTEEEIGIIEGD